MAAKHGRDGDKRDEGWGGDQRRPRLRQMAAKDGRDGNKRDDGWGGGQGWLKTGGSDCRLLASKCILTVTFNIDFVI